MLRQEVDSWVKKKYKMHILWARGQQKGRWTPSSFHEVSILWKIAYDAYHTSYDVVGVGCSFSRTEHEREHQEKCAKGERVLINIFLGSLFSFVIRNSEAELTIWPHNRGYFGLILAGIGYGSDIKYPVFNSDYSIKYKGQQSLLQHNRAYS